MSKKSPREDRRRNQEERAHKNTHPNDRCRHYLGHRKGENPQTHKRKSPTPYDTLMGARLRRHTRRRKHGWHQ